MTPREELLTMGRLGEEGARLLYNTVRLVVVAYRFPAPDGRSAWNESDFLEVAHDFLKGKKAQGRMLDMASRSTDDRSFGRQLEAAVRNILRDRARATDLGKLIVRVKSVLRDTADFVELPQRGENLWALTGGPTELSDATDIQLTRAVMNVEVVVPAWTSDKRDAPLADHDSFMRLMIALLREANGSLTAPDIARVLTSRLDHRRTPLTVDIDGDRGRSEPPAPKRDNPSAALSMIRATEIFASLSDRQRIIVTSIDSNVRELGEAIGIGKSQAATMKKHLGELLAHELEDDDEPELTISALTELCEDWIRDRTDMGDATST